MSIVSSTLPAIRKNVRTPQNEDSLDEIARAAIAHFRFLLAYRQRVDETGAENVSGFAAISRRSDRASECGCNGSARYNSLLRFVDLQ